MRTRPTGDRTRTARPARRDLRTAYQPVSGRMELRSIFLTGSEMGLIDAAADRYAWSRAYWSRRVLLEAARAQLAEEHNAKRDGPE